MTLSLFLATGGLFDPIAKPLASVLAFFYGLIPNYGIAIVLLTIAMMIVLTPLTIKQTRSMLVMQKLQPEMKKLQDLHKNDRQALNEAVMALYKEHNASPLGGCLPMLLPFPLFIGLLQVLRGLSHTVKIAGKTVAVPKYLSPHTRIYQDIVKAGGKLDAFGMDLAKSARTVGGGFAHSLPYFVLLLAMVGTQFYQQYQLTSKNPAAKSQPGQALMMKFFPLFFGVLSFQFPAGVVLYWTVSNFIRVGQQWALYRYDPKVKALVAKDVKEIEAKTREIDARDSKASGRSRFRDLLTNASEAAADRKGGGGKDAAKPGGKPSGDRTGAPGRGGRTPPGKATGGASGVAKSQRPGSSGAAKSTGSQKASPQKPGAPKGGAPKTPPLKPGGVTAGGVKPGGVKPGGVKPGGVKPGGVSPGGVSPGGVKPGGVKPGGVKPGGLNPGGVKPGGGPKPGGARPGAPASGSQKAGPLKAPPAKASPSTPIPPEKATPVAPATNTSGAAQASTAAPAVSSAPAVEPAPATRSAASSPPTGDSAPTATSGSGGAPTTTPATADASTTTPATAANAPVPDGASAAAIPAGAPSGPAASPPVPANGTNGASAQATPGDKTAGNGTTKPSVIGEAASQEGTDAVPTGNGATAKGRTGGGSARNVSSRRRRKGR